MSLKEQVSKSKIEAMKAHDSKRNGALIFIKAAITQHEVDKRTEATDDVVLGILNKMVKQRKDSISQYESAGRHELADIEKYELTVISEFLPAQVSEEDVDNAIQTAIKTAGATSIKDLGKVMALLKTELNGKADMGVVGQKAKSLLS